MLNFIYSWIYHAENLNQSKIQSGNSCNHSQRGHRAISHVSNLNIFLENNISNWNSNNWSNCNNLHLFFLLTYSNRDNKCNLPKQSRNICNVHWLQGRWNGGVARAISFLSSYFVAFSRYMNFKKSFRNFLRKNI